jgi:uncharacterized ubiquitin-like protein YukD
MRNQRIIKEISMPKEIEEYIVQRLLNIDDFIKSKISIVDLIRLSWYLSYYPFTVAIYKLFDYFIQFRRNFIKNNTIILIDNLMRKKERIFDTFFAGDLAWALGIYLNELIKDSKLLTYRNKNIESNFPYNDIFPFKNISKIIYEVEDINFTKDIDKYMENGIIIYITKLFRNYYSYYDDFDKRIRNYRNIKTPSIILWELRPCCKINSENYKINYIQGFTKDNLAKIESLLTKY